MSILDFALGLAGMSDDTVQALDRQLPVLARLAADAKEAEPILTKMKSHLDALEPMIVELWPILQKAWPDIVAVTPTIEQLIDFVNAKQKEG